MRFSALAAAATLAVLAAGSVARAGDAEQFAKRMFATNLAAPGKSHACFVRRYDGAHLATHPRQKVRVMRLLVTAEKLPEDEALNYTFSLALKYRNGKTEFTSGGSCGHPSEGEKPGDELHLGCGVDCDGGGLSVELTTGDKSARVKIDEIAMWDSNKPSEERGSFEGGADDRVFRLDRAALDECASLMEKTDDLAAGDKK